MVMGNVSGRQDGEGCSGVKKREYEEGFEQSLTELGHGDPMLHSPPHQSPRAFQPPPIFTSQVPMDPLPRSGDLMQVRNHAAERSMAYYEELSYEKQVAATITWSLGGKQVAVTGSWDNWENVDPLWRLGKDFVIMKMLPSGVYHYRFIVDECLRYAPDVPWECDDSGNAYNVLDLQEYIPEVPPSLSEFEQPPSPPSSYDNQPLSESDFAKLPPELPPQLQITSLNRPSSSSSDQSLLRPQHTVLNHLFIQNTDGRQPMAIGSTHRFRQKYVTVVLYKPSGR
ncbi:SNF1-related protein kinase regulatory subunit beta-2 [Citrus sinensis]|uniref:SNF1-related protein kinase regulatory subunit beta-2 n=2 Tax=Citrus sinensis TaxID=2711 RepID=A0ACB8N6I0_CITSI|nr:SNF1-related protein kinase regulatory subunit beta-2 [Citrus sinensis]